VRGLQKDEELADKGELLLTQRKENVEELEQPEQASFLDTVVKV
jgi:hypothetical protein